jgi:hypothetical protein
MDTSAQINSQPGCPGCHSCEEPFEHVLLYPCPETTAHREAGQQELDKGLSDISTPPPVQNAILHSFSDWLRTSPTGCSRPLTFGSVRGPNMLLSTVYMEQ